MPFLEDLGHPVPPFDFRVKGVSSISLDAHKYGYAPKGVSILLHRRRENRRKQFFIHTDWPGGIFASTTFMGTKSGGAIAGCWAIMKHLGREGYRDLAARVMDCAQSICKGIEELDGIRLVAEPAMSVLAFTSEHGNTYNIGDALAKKGWYLDRLQFPEALHLTVTHLNIGREGEFLQDLEEILAAEQSLLRAGESSRSVVRWAGVFSSLLPASLLDRAARYAGSVTGKGKNSGNTGAALYGISATFSNRDSVHRMVENLLDGMYE